MLKTSFVAIEGYKQTPLESADEDGCKLNKDLMKVKNCENDSENSNLKGSIMSPTVWTN
jgi:hypothetical protein